ncbi:MAG: AtpZ/AtpI family protein [Clostridiales bacterium]|nr:AtpZ/AtpI family protein [Clostridiales bacterium]
MIIPIIGGVYFGNYLDVRFGTGSLFLFVFIIIGVITAFMNLFKMTIRKSNNKKDGK